MLNNYGLGHFIVIFASSWTRPTPGQTQDSLSHVLLLTSFSDTTLLQRCHRALPSFTSVPVTFLQPRSLPKGAKRRAATAIPGSRSANSAEDGRAWAILEGKAPPCEDKQGAGAGCSYGNYRYYQNLLCSDRKSVVVPTALAAPVWAQISVSDSNLDREGEAPHSAPSHPPCGKSAKADFTSCISLWTTSWTLE